VLTPILVARLVRNIVHYAEPGIIYERRLASRGSVFVLPYSMGVRARDAAAEDLVGCTIEG